MDVFKEKNFEKKQELIESAIIEFGNNGFEQASLNNILKETGISKGTFYYHFKNKEELYLFLLTSFAEEKMIFFKERLTPELLNQDFFTLLEKLVEYGLEFATQNPQMHKFTESFMKEKNSQIYHKLIEHFGEQRNDFLDSFIENAYNKGQLRHDISIQFQKSMISYLMAHVVEIVDILKVDDFKKVGNDLIKFIKNGFEYKKLE